MDKAAQLRVSGEIFGGSGGQQFVKFLDEGVDGIRRLKDEFARSGNLISAEDLKRAEALQTAIKNLQDAIDNLGRAFLRTGIAQWLTDVATKMAQWVTQVVDAVPALARWGTVLAVVGAGLSAILIVVGSVVSAIGTIITALSAFSVMASAVGLSVSGAFAALAVVWAPVAATVAALVAAWLVVKDQVLPVLDVLKQRAVDVLGPAFAGLIDAAKAVLSSLGAAFTALWQGPVGEGLRTAGSIISGFAAILTRVFGEVGIGVIKIFVTVLTGALNAIAIIIRGLTALLSGDWEGAWKAAGDLVNSVVQTVISVFDTLTPGIGAALSSMYESVKEYIVSGVGRVFDWIGERAGQIAVEWANAFGPAIDWAKSLYEGVKTWISDRLGPLIERAVSWINILKAAFSGIVQAAQTGGGARPAPPPAPPPPAPPPPGAPPPDLSGGGSSKKPKGKTEAELAAQRELLRLQAELAAAKAKGDADEVRRLEDIIDRRARIKAYESAGLANAAAQVAADRDRALLAAARAEATRKFVEQRQDEVSLQVAQIDGDRKIVDLLEHKRELARLVIAYQAEGLQKDKATFQAQQDLLRIEDARVRMRQRLLAEARQEHAITLAQLSGNEKLARRLQDQREVEQRARRYYSEGLYDDPDKARGQASLEVGRESQARKYGENRDMFSSAFSDGIRAAMAGDLNGFLSNQFGTFMSEAFKRAGAQVFDKLFGGFDAAVEGTAQGAAMSAAATPAIVMAGQTAALAMGTSIQMAGTQVASSIAAAMSSGGSALSGGGSMIGRLLSGLPKFATGGTISPSGASGIDSQLVSFWKSPREAVHIGAPSQMGGRGGTNIFDLRGAVTTQDLIDQMNQIGRTSEDRANSWSTKNVPGLSQSQTAKQQQYSAGRRQR